jgi:hypothetical protein
MAINRKVTVRRFYMVFRGKYGISHHYSMSTLGKGFSRSQNYLGIRAHWGQDIKYD